MGNSMAAATTTVTANIAQGIEIAGELVKNFEGLALKAYICAGGKKTIGYGHAIRSYEQISDHITERQANRLLEEDLQQALNVVRKYCSPRLSNLQEAALISFTFNCGSGALQASSLRQKLNRGEYLEAAEEFPRWVYAGGIKRAGLVRRRMLERNLFISGTNNG
jgi:lysozyme